MSLGGIIYFVCFVTSNFNTRLFSIRTSQIFRISPGEQYFYFCFFLSLSGSCHFGKRIFAKNRLSSARGFHCFALFKHTHYGGQLHRPRVYSIIKNVWFFFFFFADFSRAWALSKRRADTTIILRQCGVAQVNHLRIDSRKSSQCGLVDNIHMYASCASGSPRR